MLVAMTKEETEKLIRIKNKMRDMLVISEDDAYNFAHTCLTCGLDFVKRKRTEKEILKDFEKLGYKVEQDNDMFLEIGHFDDELEYEYICFNKDEHTYEKYMLGGETMAFTIQEHKLLNELFTLWGWL